MENYNKQCLENSSYATILSYNIRSFGANSDAMLTIFHNQFSYPDLTILSETWFTEDNRDGIPMYNSYHTTR